MGKFADIIQGGMGVAVSNWRLAKTVAQKGKIGVVSGTALDCVMARRLQMGDPGGDIERALDAFPWQDMVKRAWDRYFVPGGKPPTSPFKPTPMPSVTLRKPHVELLLLGNFVEVFLAKEGHEGTVGINYLEKIQFPTLPSLLGAMLAGVNVVMMGAGIPLAIPGVLDQLAAWEPAELKIQVDTSRGVESLVQHFDPREFILGDLPDLTRPDFFAIVSSDIVAKTMARKASGTVDGFVIEYHTAGGHNAPPRRSRGEGVPTAQQYGTIDLPDIAKIRELGKPFWLGGGYASPKAIADAKELGATGVQIGTAFALSEESGIDPEIRAAMIRNCLTGELTIRTDFAASPTGYPFKLATFDLADPLPERCRVCDLGYLRRPWRMEDGRIIYRCPSEPVEGFLKKGGATEETVGRQCLCNGLLATIGLSQIRNGEAEPPMLTMGEDVSFLPHLLGENRLSYSASELIDYLDGKTPSASSKGDAS